MITVNILGQGTLADAARKCCERHFIATADSPQILWVCYDTPIGENDKPDTQWVIDRIAENLPPIGSDTLILVSSQVPVGTTKRLETMFPSHAFANSPENIRVASAVDDFNNQARVVVGRRTDKYDSILSQLFAPFTSNLILTDPETACMVKHALNCYLAMSIAFINEISRVSSVVGADVNVISKALTTERRISPNAPLRAGPPFGLGHLARDLYNLRSISDIKGVSIPLISSISASNAVHAMESFGQPA